MRDLKVNVSLCKPRLWGCDEDLQINYLKNNFPSQKKKKIKGFILIYREQDKGIDSLGF